MKRILFALALMLLPSVAFAQCNGVFANNTVCGNISGGPNIPGQVPAASLVTAAGGTSGQTQYNNSGVLGGYTPSQDCTVVPSTGVTTCAKLQNVPVTATGATTNDVMYYNGTGWLHNALLSLLNTICTASPSSCATLLGYTNVKWYGAVGDGATDDTTAFQNAVTATCGTSGTGTLLVPATTTSYLVTKINHTNCNNSIIQGVGDQSVIKMVTGDVNGNWWDLSGSNNIQFKNLKFVDNGSPVRIGFLWACTGTSCGTSGVVAGLNFDHVTVNGKFVLAGLYGYGYGPLSSFFVGGGALSITNSTWQTTYNSVTLVGEETRTAVLDLTAYNAGSVRSVYQTLTTSTAIASQTYISNTLINDAATSGSTKSNNAAIVTDGVNQFTMMGGQVGCICVSDFIGWTSDEGVTFVQTAFQQPIGGVACTTTNWIEFGGGVNAAIGLYNVLFSCPGSGGAIIALDQGVGASAGGIWFLTFQGADIGLNTFGDPIIGKTAAGCGSFTATNNWIIGSNLTILAGGNNIVTCGSIDSSTIIQAPGTITLPGSSIDNSTHIGDKSNGTWTPADNSGAALAFTNVSANWTRIGNVIFAYATLTYPATANGSAASISGLPVTVPNVGYASQCSVSNTTSANLGRVLPTINTKNATLLSYVGGAVTNVQMTGAVLTFICTYPAT
jgi:hypothetical protein